MTQPMPILRAAARAGASTSGGALLLLVLVSSLAAQGSAPLCKPNRYPVTFSTESGSPADIFLCTPMELVPEVLEVLIPAAGLGVSTGGPPPPRNVDAFSEGSDFFVYGGPAGFGFPVVSGTGGPCGPFPPPPGSVGCPLRVLRTEFSVDPPTLGLIGAVPIEATGNGASADVFAWQVSFSGASVPPPPPPCLQSDGLCLADFEDVDALGWYEKKVYPVYFSVDAPTAAALSAAIPGITAATILTVCSEGSPPVIYMDESDLGLVAGDDINALAVDKGGVVLFSLKRGSPTALALPTMGSAGIWVAQTSIGGPVRSPWAFPIHQGLGPGDDLNGLRVSDPAPQFEGSFTGQSDWNETLFVEGSTGGIDRRVPLQAGVPFVIDMHAPFGQSVCALQHALLIRLGRPCPSQGAGVGNGYMALPPGVAEIAIGTPPLTQFLAPFVAGQLGLCQFGSPFLVTQVPQPVEFSIQFVALLPPSAPAAFYISPMITCEVRP